MQDKQVISVVLVDDHSLVRDGIKSLLAKEPHIDVIEEASDGQQGLNIIAELEPDVAIIDIRMPGMDGIETVRHLTQASTSTKALMLSMHDAEEYILNAVEVGAHGYLLKDASKQEFLTAIQTVAQGEKYFSGSISKVIVDGYLRKVGGHHAPAKQKKHGAKDETTQEKGTIKLTRREQQILELVTEGLKSKEIAEQLEVSVRTVEAHRFSLMKKVEVHNVVDLTKKAQELGLI